jgi:alpha-1,2-mannosyltransferase
VFGLLPLLIVGLAVYEAFAGGYAAGDFRHSFLVAGWRELHGIDPYHWTRAQFARQLSFPYPALAVILLEPFALLPGDFAGDLYLVLCIGAIFGTLRLLDVRDWRVYGVVLLWSPVLIGWQTGNFTLPLMFGCAAAWKYRSRPWVVGLITGLLVSIKPTMFPVAVWLLLTHRYKATAVSVGSALVMNAVAWTAIGWNELGSLLHLVSIQSAAMYHTGYSLIALAAHLGVGRSAGTAIQFLVALVVLGASVYVARLRRDAATLVLALALCLVASPLVDQHYFAFLVVPLALAFPRLRWPWVLPILLWACPAAGGSTWQVGLWLVAAAVCIGAAVRSLIDERQPGEASGLRQELPSRLANEPGLARDETRLATGGHV